jgi:hypothetical protein
VSEAGTYEVTTDHFITMRPIVAKNPAVMGRGVHTLLQAGRRHDLGDPMRNQNGPFANPVTVKAVRVE